MSDTDDGLLHRVCDIPFMDEHPGFPGTATMPTALPLDWAASFMAPPSPFPPGSGSFSSLLEDLLTEPPLEDTAAVVTPPPPTPAAAPPRERYHPKGELLSEVLRRISSERTEFLAQVWVPTVRNSHLMLTTQDQPYAVQPTRWDLVRYRTLSARYAFPTSGSGVLPGLPGRVYSRMLPEWSPNVQFYDVSEFLRVQDAARCNVRGTLAVPVIEMDTKQCVAVIELVANVEKLGYEAEIGMICKTLQDVNLSCWSENGVQSEVPRAGRDAAFQEITRVLAAVCENHQLPLAQTWFPIESSSSSSSDQTRLTTNSAPFYVKGSSLEGFRRACSQQRLEAGQGVVGKASTTNLPSFIRDVKSYSISEYPLVNYARYFNLGAAVAIRLRSRHTEIDDYVLEFFLPVGSTEEIDHRQLLDGISATMKQCCGSLRTLTSQEVLEQWTVVSSPRLVEINSAACDEDVSGVVVDNYNTTTTATSAKKRRNSGEVLESSYWSACSLQEDGPEVKSKTARKKVAEKKRASNEKTVSLDVLQQHFAGSLRDAAKSIGVCPTTLKRICRQHGISRWPSRKINKVNRSLVKLQGVINSVEGVDRKVKLDSLAGEIASTAAATAAITLKHSSSGPSTSSETSLKAEPGQGKEGMNVFQGSGSDSSPAKTPELHSSESTRLNLLPAIKIEPRVHGSFEALSVLDQLPPPPPVVAAASDHEHLNRNQPAGTSYIDWPALGSRLASNVAATGMNCFEERMITVKATMAADTIRFKLGMEVGFKVLKSEVGCRFGLDKEAFTLKYMDDDSEWVVLCGDADLEECLDVMRSCGSRVMKLVVQPLNPNAGSPSFCSVNS